MKKVNLQKFKKSYYKKYRTKIELVNEFDFKNYINLNKYIKDNDLSIACKCKVCGVDSIINSYEEFSDLEYGTVCNKHKLFTICPKCLIRWINDETNLICDICKKNIESTVNHKYTIWKSRQLQIYENIKDELEKDEVKLLNYIYNNNTLSSKIILKNIDKIFSNTDYEFYDEYFIDDYIYSLIERQIIFKKGKTFEILEEIQNIISKGRGYTLYSNNPTKEDKIFELLNSSFGNYKIIRQYRPKWLGMQRIDFYIEEVNVAIEWNGEQHYKSVEKYGGFEGLKLIQDRDQKKRILCKKNKLPLLELEYHLSEKQIITKVNNFIKKHSKK